MNDLFPGLIKEPKRVPVRVPVPSQGRKDTDKIKQKAAENYPLLFNVNKKARDGTRTRGLDLGKVALHQLSHSRISG